MTQAKTKTQLETKRPHAGEANAAGMGKNKDARVGENADRRRVETASSPSDQKPYDPVAKAEGKGRPAGSRVRVAVKRIVVPGSSERRIPAVEAAMYKEIDLPLDVAAAIDGAYDEIPGSHEGGVALAVAAMNLMTGFESVIAHDVRWARSRSHDQEFQALTQALRVAQALWGVVRLGLTAANWNGTSTWQRQVVRQSAKIAKKAVHQLEKLRPEFGRLSQKLGKARPVLDCVEAWQQALPLVDAARKLKPRAPTEEVVRGVIAELSDLGARLKLEDAIKGASAHGEDVFDVIRSRWGKGKSLIRKAPREVAFEVARWACGVGSAKSVKKLCEFAKAADLGTLTLG